jgi:hypothetical protein
MDPLDPDLLEVKQFVIGRGMQIDHDRDLGVVGFTLAGGGHHPSRSSRQRRDTRGQRKLQEVAPRRP